MKVYFEDKSEKVTAKEALANGVWALIVGITGCAVIIGGVLL